MIEVRIAEADDAKLIAKAERKYIDCPWTEEQIVAEIQNGAARFVVATIDGRFAGYLSGELAADECEISNIAVLERYRRRGVGRALFGKLTELVRAQGAQTMFLLVADDNLPAIGLYKAIGFVETGRRRKYYRDKDALIMRLDL